MEINQDVAILNTILAAAAQASIDDEQADYTINDISDRNEQWTQSYVGVGLNDFSRRMYRSEDGVFVVHEPRVSWMREMTGSAPQRGAPRLSSSQRFDLAVRRADQYVEGLVEIKNAPGIDSNRFTRDAIKLEKALRTWDASAGGTLRWAVYLFSVRLTAAAVERGEIGLLQIRYAERLELLHRQVGDRIRADRFLIPDTDGVCHIGWGAVVLR